MKLLGIDPGAISGAYAILDTDTGLAFVGDIPVIDKNVNCPELARIIDLHEPDRAIIERVGSMPGQGISSAFSFGRGVGRIEGVVAGMMRIEFVTPQVWKKHFRLPGGPKNKEMSRARAIQLFPSVTGLARKMDSGRAEALLIAKWYAEKHLETRA